MLQGRKTATWGYMAAFSFYPNRDCAWWSECDRADLSRDPELANVPQLTEEQVARVGSAIVKWEQHARG